MRRFQPYFTSFSQSLQDLVLCLDSTTWKLASFASKRDNTVSVSCFPISFWLPSVYNGWNFKGQLFNSAVFLGAVRRDIESSLN